MFASSILFAALASMAIAAPVAPEARSDGAPAGWAYGYLENYETYHTRYLALDCQDQHDTEFFDQCCHPLLATETLEANRPAQCIPDASATSSAAAEEATNTAANNDAKAQFQAATSTVAEPSSASPSPAAASPSADSSSNDDSSNDDSSSSNSGGNVNTGGFATFFYQNGNAGACGNYNSDSTPLVAIDQAWWSNFGQVSPHCGQWVEITNTQNGKSVKAQVQDVCPTCANGNSLDLSTGAFNQIADESEGSVPISWSFV
jgi:hypothetical protein